MADSDVITNVRGIVEIVYFVKYKIDCHG